MAWLANIMSMRFRGIDPDRLLYVGALSEVRGIRQMEVAGSFRRRQETVGDVDILVSAAKPKAAPRRESLRTSLTRRSSCLNKASTISSAVARAVVPAVTAGEPSEHGVRGERDYANSHGRDGTVLPGA